MENIVALAIIGFFTTVITALVTFGPVGRALAERLRGYSPEHDLVAHQVTPAGS